jgi:hypothetical protein
MYLASRASQSWRAAQRMLLVQFSGESRLSLKRLISLLLIILQAVRLAAIPRVSARRRGHFQFRHLPSFRFACPIYPENGWFSNRGNRLFFSNLGRNNFLVSRIPGWQLRARLRTTSPVSPKSAIMLTETPRAGTISLSRHQPVRELCGGCRNRRE